MSIDSPAPGSEGQESARVGIANEHSIAYGCAKAFRELGADLAITYLNEKARPYVEPLARELEAPLFLPLDVSTEARSKSVFEAVAAKWGALDILVHSIAFAPKEDLQGGLLNCSAAGFAKAMDVSCHSFVRMARLAAPLMKDGGTMFAMSYHGASKVVPTYSVMGPVKAALEACCRYLAYELGGKGIRVHAISPGPLKTRAASGLKDFDLLLTEAAQARADRRAGRHHGRGLHVRLSCDPVRAPAFGRNALCRRRREHHGLTVCTPSEVLGTQIMNHAREFSVSDVLKDGTRVTIRAIRPDDRDRFLEAFRLLEKDSIYTRFFSLRNDLSDAELDRAVNVDFVREVALVVTTETVRGETIIAAGRYIASEAPNTERSAEVAFVVEEDYQGRGIASRLLAHLAALARGQGLTHFEADVLSQNSPMLAVFKRCGFPMRQRRDGGVIHLTLELAANDSAAG